MCTQSVQLNVGLRNKSPMGVLAHYTNICKLQQYQYTAKYLGSAKYVRSKNDRKDIDVVFVDGRGPFRCPERRFCIFNYLNTRIINESLRNISNWTNLLSERQTTFYSSANRVSSKCNLCEYV